MTIKKFFFLLLIILCVKENNAQTLEGTSGLFFVPSAEIQADKQVNIGACFVNRNLISFGGFQKDAYTPYITMSYLPFAEFGVKITRLINHKSYGQGIGDRTFSIRVRFIEEKEIMPAVLVGLHDVLTVFGGTEAIHNNALYIVATKNYKTGWNMMDNIMFNAGYGSDVLDAQNHNFVGVFGGVSFKFYSIFELMTEYDGKYTNSGIKLKLFNHISLIAGVLRLKHFSGGLSFNFIL